MQKNTAPCGAGLSVHLGMARRIVHPKKTMRRTNAIATTMGCSAIANRVFMAEEHITSKSPLCIAEYSQLKER